MTQRKNATRSRQELMQEVRTTGVWAAYEAALDVCRDKKAAAPARATAAATLFRVAGYFAPKSDFDPSDDGDVVQMTTEQRAARIAYLQQRQTELDAEGLVAAESDDDEGSHGVFD